MEEFVLPEIILIGTGIISILGCIIQIIGLILAGRRTNTHFYIGYAALLWLIGLFMSPTFHRFYNFDIYEYLDLRNFLSVLCCTMVLGNTIVLMLLFFMDYFRFIDTYAKPLMIAHFVILIFIALLYYFVLEVLTIRIFLIVALIALIWIVFLLIFLLHRDLECLKSRKATDDESQLRYTIVLLFITVKVVAVILGVLETMASYIARSFVFGAFAIGLCQLDSIWILIVLLKVDDCFRTKLAGFFKMCSCSTGNKVHFENLPSDNGRLIHQEA